MNKRKSTSASAKLPGLKVTANELAKDGALKFGQLWKAGNWRKTMHERFFVLRPSCYLFYFKKSTDTAPAGVVEVVSYEAKMEEELKDEDDGYQFPFKLQSVTNPSGERVFHLEASSAAERKQWFQAFERMRVMNQAMRTGSNVVEEQKAEIADLKDRLRDKAAALQAARGGSEAAAGAGGATGGSGAHGGAAAAAVASYKAEIVGLERRLASAQQEIAEANNRADAIQASALAAASAESGDGHGAAEALAAKDSTIAKKDKELKTLRTKLDLAAAANTEALGLLRTMAAELGGTLPRVEDSAAGVTEAVAACAKLAKQAVHKAAESAAATAGAGAGAGAGSKSKRKNKRKGKGKASRTQRGRGSDSDDDSDDSDDSDDGALGAGVGAGAGAGAGKQRATAGSGAGAAGGGSATTQVVETKLRERAASSKAVATVKDLDRLPPPWFPDRAIARCQMCSKSFGMFRRKHHCRRCGRCVCATCAPSRCVKPLREFGYKEPVLHCVDCFDLFAV